MMDWLNRDSDIVAGKLAHSAPPAVLAGGFGMKKRIIDFITAVRTAMYPNIYQDSVVRAEFLHTVRCNHLHRAAMLLFEMCCDVLFSTCCDSEKDSGTCDRCKTRADEITRAFIDSLPDISDILRTDIRAAYEGDPAAISEEEVLLAYPAFEAISIFRLAHRMYELKLPLLPRMMTEYAHQLTGIDIHPGATIGSHFFIDHGTGVVIGETCVIGEHVKLYQGVTLGAKSFENDENGNPIKGIKRHPNIGNNVIIYAGATILGGSTYIGDNCVIGGNVWLTHSVESGRTVYNQK